MDASPIADFVCMTNKTQLSFNHMRNREDLSDVILRCGRKEFPVHRFLLAACSPYFKSFFEKRSDAKINIVLDNVKRVDLEHALTYMYNGCVVIKNDDIQGFCELLEMFLMPLPEDIDVTENNETENEIVEMESFDETDSEYETDEDEYDDFVQSMRERLEYLNKNDLKTQASDILDICNAEWNDSECDGAELYGPEFDILVNLILQLVVQPKFTENNNLIVPLVKCICIQDDCTQLRDDTQYFRENLCLKSLKLFTKLTKNLEQRETLELNTSPSFTNSFDLQVNLMQSIDYYCIPLRSQRIAHFIGHLVQMNIISMDQIKDFTETNPFLEEIQGKKHANDNCCNFDLDPIVQTGLNDKWYESIKSLENQLFWSRSEIVLASGEFTPAIWKKVPRKRRREKKSKSGKKTKNKSKGKNQGGKNREEILEKN